MTEAELAAIEAHVGEWANGATVMALVAEVRRLRGLIARARIGADYCPWCDRSSNYDHTYDCPAFTPDGKVK